MKHKITDRKNNKNNKDRNFYGTTTLGEKGQVVIPIEARAYMKLKTGDRLLVFGMGQDMVSFSKIEQLEKFASHLAHKLESIKKLIKKAR